MGTLNLVLIRYSCHTSKFTLPSPNMICHRNEILSILGGGSKPCWAIFLVCSIINNTPSYPVFLTLLPYTNISALRRNSADWILSLQYYSSKFTWNLSRQVSLYNNCFPGHQVSTCECGLGITWERLPDWETPHKVYYSTSDHFFDGQNSYKANARELSKRIRGRDEQHRIWLFRIPPHSENHLHSNMNYVENNQPDMESGTTREEKDRPVGVVEARLSPCLPYRRQILAPNLLNWKSALESFRGRGWKLLRFSPLEWTSDNCRMPLSHPAPFKYIGQRKLPM